MTRYRPQMLIDFAAALFAAGGTTPADARTIAEILVEADLLGHDTHGLQLAAPYLRDLASGTMRATGEPDIVSDRKAAVVWNGRGLSGVTLTAAAVDLAGARAREYGLASVAIGHAHHIGCLSAYLERATKRGQMVIIVCSDPAVATVAPFGGLDPVFTPDPLAIGIPTGGDPILIDMSASITTNGMATRLNNAGRRFPAKWAQDATGNATDDPGVLFDQPKGTLLPTGGHDHGHKGYGMALAIEALSQGLSGVGRSSKPTHWGASVLVQVFEPEAFAGLCHAARAAPGVDAVRLPGERALAGKRAALRDGLELYPGIMEKLAPWGEKLGVAVPPGV